MSMKTGSTMEDVILFSESHGMLISTDSVISKPPVNFWRISKVMLTFSDVLNKSIVSQVSSLGSESFT